MGFCFGSWEDATITPRYPCFFSVCVCVSPCRTRSRSIPLLLPYLSSSSSVPTLPFGILIHSNQNDREALADALLAAHTRQVQHLFGSASYIFPWLGKVPRELPIGLELERGLGGSKRRHGTYLPRFLPQAWGEREPERQRE